MTIDAATASAGGAPNGANANGADGTVTPNSDPWAGLGAPNGDPEAIGYNIPDRYIGQKRRVRVITIGGGASGINMAYQIKKYMENVEHVVYEKSAELGGTWLDNR